MDIPTKSTHFVLDSCSEGTLALCCVTCSSLIETVEEEEDGSVQIVCPDCHITFDYQEDILPYIYQYCNLVAVNYIEIDQRLERLSALPIQRPPVRVKDYPISVRPVEPNELGLGGYNVGIESIHATSDNRKNHPQGAVIATRMVLWTAVSYLSEEARSIILDTYTGTIADLSVIVDRSRRSGSDESLRETLLEELEDITFLLRERKSDKGNMYDPLGPDA